MAALWKSITAGAIAGAAAVAVMNGYQSAVNAATKKLTGKPALNLDDAATRELAVTVAEGMCGFKLREAQQRTAFYTVQYSLGILIGALYGVLAERLPATTACAGTGFGAAAWLVGDEIVVPLAGIAQGPEYHSVSGHANALAGHIVYGAATHFVRRALLQVAP